MKRVGIYAGTFDPIHEGHLAFANQAIKQASLDKVFFLTEPRPRRKQGVHALEHREAMVRLAIAGREQFGSIQLEQINFTPEETLPKLQALFEGTQLHLLMGDDVLVHLSDWPHVERLINACSFIIGLRKISVEKLKQYISGLENARGLSLNVDFIDTDKQDIASSKLRREVKQSRSVNVLLPAIRQYVLDNGLYISEE